MFERTIGQNILEKSYKVLFGLGTMIEDNTLKCNSQCPKLTHILAMLTRLFRYILSLTITLRCFHNNLLGPEVKQIVVFDYGTSEFFSQK